MPTVPKESRSSPDMPFGTPSDVDFMMALAVMKQRGLIDRLDPEAQGRVEDRRKERFQLGDMPILGYTTGQPPAPPKIGKLQFDLGLDELTRGGRASLGVSGGSR